MEMLLVGGVDHDPTRFPPPARPRLPEARCDRDHDRAALSTDHLELVPLADGRLVDVPADDQVGSRVDEAREHVRPVSDRPLTRSPRCSDELMVKGYDAERAGRCGQQPFRDALDLRVADPARLVMPRPDRVDPDGLDVGRGIEGLRRFPLALELPPRVRESGRKGVWNVVVSWDHEQWSSEPAQELRGALVLGAPSAVCEVPAGNDQLRLETFRERRDRAFDLRIVLSVPRADVDVRHVEDAGAHRRSRLQ